MLKIHNSLTDKKEEFTPVNYPKLNMYTCGVTVYDHCHIGHARSLYIFEVIRRYLKFKGYDIKLVRNITDVDDKIINKARTWVTEQNISLIDAFNKVRNTYIDSYYEDLKLLNIPMADSEPKATENISEMIEFITRLIHKGFAYEREGSVYFSVRKFIPYGKLSGKKIDDLLTSVRVENDPLKQDPLDFAMWKKAKDDEPYWESPWGQGRPGWHIECSVMSRKFLGVDTLDIHGGGLDLVFPHHENELAQSEALHGKDFAKYWIHHGLLTVNKEKMAKSLGNFFTIKDVLKKYPADILKMLYLHAHYRTSLDFSWERLEEMKKAYERLMILVDKLKKIPDNKQREADCVAELRAEFIEAMDDDFNAPKGLAALFDLVNWANRIFDGDEPKRIIKLLSAYDLILEICTVFNLGLDVVGGDMTDADIDAKVNERSCAKVAKDYALADKLRKELEAHGVIIEDSKTGTTWRRKI
jgi:cysteinyl-tRNA synthetase